MAHPPRLAPDCALGGIDQRPDLLQLAAEDASQRLRQQQPGPGPDKPAGQRREPALNRRTFAAQ